MNVILDKYYNKLIEDRNRFFNAGMSGYFCDEKQCLDTAYLLGNLIITLTSPIMKGSVKIE